MSITNVVPYFRTVMNSLGHREWTDAFNDDDIPRTVLDRSYHIELGALANDKQNQDLIEVVQSVAVKLYVKGFRNTADGRDKSAQYMDAIIKKALEDDRRAQSYAGVKNVRLVGGDIGELSTDNDNAMRVTINFNCHLIMANS